MLDRENRRLRSLDAAEEQVESAEDRRSEDHLGHAIGGGRDDQQDKEEEAENARNIGLKNQIGDDGRVQEAERELERGCPQRGVGE